MFDLDKLEERERGGQQAALGILEITNLEFFSRAVDTVEVISVVGGRANLPCDLTPPFPSDEPHLILFYKDVYGTPIYR